MPGTTKWGSGEREAVSLHAKDPIPPRLLPCTVDRVSGGLSCLLFPFPPLLVGIVSAQRLSKKRCSVPVILCCLIIRPCPHGFPYRSCTRGRGCCEVMREQTIVSGRTSAVQMRVILPHCTIRAYGWTSSSFFSQQLLQPLTVAALPIALQDKSEPDLFVL